MENSVEASGGALESNAVLVAAWLKELATQRRQSPHTLIAYRQDLDRLLALSETRPFNVLSAHDIRRSLSRLHASGLSGSSLARTLSAWRGFFRWLGRCGHVEANPCDGLKAPKSPSRLPKTLSPDEAAYLLAQDENPEGDDGAADPARVRDQAMFELFYSSGLRLSELISLDIDCVGRIREGEVEVTGKRSKMRIVPVGKMAQKAIEDWLSVRSLLSKSDEKALFVGKRGRRVAPRVVELQLTALAVSRGLPQHVHPHMLRHSFASHVLQSSGDLRAVQDMLGHESIASTQVYTHLDFQHLSRIYDATHPRAQRKKKME